MAVTKILYLAHNHATIEKINRTYPRDFVKAVRFGAATGHRAEVVVVEPFPQGLSDMEKATYGRILEESRCRCINLGLPIVIGDLQHFTIS